MATSAAGLSAEDIGFNRDIRPLLSDQCFACHGFDAKKRKAGLRLDLAEGAYAANREGRVAIKPGDPEGSELWRRLNTSDPDEVMPPPESHKTLSDAQKSLIKRWIQQGARYQNHWSFEAPVASAIPAPVNAAWTVQNPIDRFLHARLAAEKLTPTPEANRALLARRLSFDLRGLPPTPAEVEAFESDRQPGAYERLVDRWLDSPRYGEQMGRHWLDVARYADTHGLHLDNEREIWAYRDWVVRAFNRNLPFDRFTIDQLAGDLLPGASEDQLVATGFNRNNVTTGEGGAIDAEYIFRYAVDRTSTTAQAWMGLTAGCAVCHDHKFDPVSQKEFYSLYAFFHSAGDPAMDGNARRTPPVLELKSEEDQRRLEQFEGTLREREALVTAAVAKLVYQDPALLSPPPPVRTVESVWFDDDLPPGAKPQVKPQTVTAAEGPVFAGRQALKQKGVGILQDVFESVALDLPRQGKFFAHVHLDPMDPPKTIMMQFFQGNWEHRAVWGDTDAIGWGEKGKASRWIVGPLPKAGEWVRIEVDVEKLGLKPGEKITGIAYTEFGGTLYWDRTGSLAQVDPANDPLTSMAAWMRPYEGKDAKDLPEPVRKVFRESTTTNRTPDQVQLLRSHYLAKVCAETRPVIEPLTASVAEIRRQRDQFREAIPRTMVWHDLEKPRDSFVMVRGQYDKPGDKVGRSTPAALPPLRPAGDLPTRLDLARWLVSQEHPLTARVIVNRFWQQFFGIGLVKTADDFGSQGEPPSHPELLDWMSVHFRDSGWDVKALVRLIVTSAAYRQDSRAAAEIWQRDPENRLLSRGPRFRLDAEQLRDNALFVSGLLDPTVGGRGVRPYQPPNLWEPIGYSGSNTRFYKADTGAGLYRRSLYTFFKRTAPPPFMTTFDAPNREQICSRRERSNTPLQALQLLNDVQHFEAARALATRVLTEGGTAPADRIRFAYRAVLSRPPSPEELGWMLEVLTPLQARYRADAEAAKQVVNQGESRPPASLPVAELAAYTLVANLILNLDETITRN